MNRGKFLKEFRANYRKYKDTFSAISLVKGDCPFQKRCDPPLCSRVSFGNAYLCYKGMTVIGGCPHGEKWYEQSRYYHKWKGDRLSKQMMKIMEEEE